MKTRPRRLQQGDTVAIVSPASPPNPETLQRGVQFLTHLGLHVIFGENYSKVNGYLAGTDEERTHDFEQALQNPDVKAIFFAGGGYGSARLTTKLDIPLVDEHPKIIWGYSDITYLHIALQQYANVVTFHGPMVASDMGKSEFHDLSAKLLQQLFMPMELHYTEEISPLRTIHKGQAEGEIIGGNLTRIISTLGTKFEIDTTDKLFFIEDIATDVSQIDSMLHQLQLAGKLRGAKGIIIGDFTNAKSSDEKAFEEVIHHYFANNAKPAVAGFQIGHCEPNFAIPFGVKALLNADGKTLTILPGVE